MSEMGKVFAEINERIERLENGLSGVGGGCGFLAYHERHTFWVAGEGRIQCSGLTPSPPSP